MSPDPVFYVKGVAMPVNVVYNSRDSHSSINAPLIPSISVPSKFANFSTRLSLLLTPGLPSVDSQVFTLVNIPVWLAKLCQTCDPPQLHSICIELKLQEGGITFELLVLFDYIKHHSTHTAPILLVLFSGF